MRPVAQIEKELQDKGPKFHEFRLETNRLRKKYDSEIAERETQCRANAGVLDKLHEELAKARANQPTMPPAPEPEKAEAETKEG